MDEITMKRLKKVLRNSVNQKEVAGGNILVIKEGKEIFYDESGFADIESKKPICRDAIFRIYSMTKPITAVATMILMERGEIDLYDPVSKFLPGFKDQSVEQDGKLVPVDREVTLKDLLNMTSGIVYEGENMAGKAVEAVFSEIDQRLLGDNPVTTVEAMNKVGQCPLAFQPGSSWQYGASADVLGAVIEVVSGKSYGDFLKEELFQPLSMIDTDFWVPEEKRSRLVKTYAESGNGELIYYNGNHLGIINQMNKKPAFESGGAGLASTIDDYAKFANMLMNGGSLGDVQILRPNTVRYLTSGNLTNQQQKGFDQWFTLNGFSYSSLMRVMKDGGQAGFIVSAREYGWDGWLGTYFANCPDEDLTILLMIQKKDAGTISLTRKLRNIILSYY